ncbi:MAG: hypothetical protein Q4E75_02910 [bacterium]|nr:hypothetical protein [bacterium]
MDSVNIILEDGKEYSVKGLLYIYNSKYYFIYTTLEPAEEGYIQLYLVQVCKEIQNTVNGPVDTGGMIGMEISDKEEWKAVQTSIQKIVNDKKNNTQDKDIKYLPINMITTLKIISKNKFKLVNQILVDNFKINISTLNESKTDSEFESKTLESDSSSIESDVIVDYRTRFFEEQEKNKKLESEINELNNKLESIKQIIG